MGGPGTTAPPLATALHQNPSHPYLMMQYENAPIALCMLYLYNIVFTVASLVIHLLSFYACVVF